MTAADVGGPLFLRRSIPPVMAGLAPAIHETTAALACGAAWMPGTSPGMTAKGAAPLGRVVAALLAMTGTRPAGVPLASSPAGAAERRRGRGSRGHARRRRRASRKIATASHILRHARTALPGWLFPMLAQAALDPLPGASRRRG
ncbi:hypothetical protein SLNSH_19935 [Alsobacter soli]|uniref:Uncharacterized protein n=1 Tax=Alsobacter soli TaxID=2109933 RepID=A0A2T1HNJ8_9HYPH|nr:hypothetical protein SLNSH_19935 [Alsobacter soli]